MPVLAISSHVAVGHVGNAAAAPALERGGRPVWRVDTVSLSFHPGHRHAAGRVHPGHEIRDILRAVGSHTGWRDLEAVYSGYLGEAESGWAVAESVDAARAANPDLVYLCDPIIGDHGRVYVREGVETCFRERLAARADILTPNAFELARLSGHRVETVADAHAAAVTLLEWGPRVVVATGVPDGDHLAAVAVSPDGNWMARTPRHDRAFFGTGDLFGGLYLGHFLDTGDPAESLGRTLAGVAVAVEATRAADSVDLVLIPCLEAALRAEPAAVTVL